MLKIPGISVSVGILYFGSLSSFLPSNWLENDLLPKVTIARVSKRQ
jgi:hypothetical protein